MASRASFLSKSPNPSISHHQQSLEPVNFSPNDSLSLPIQTRSRKTQIWKSQISLELIKPDGEKLVELLMDDLLRQVKKREALSLSRVKLSQIDLQWVHVLSEGWVSPLHGFMKENEFLQTLHFNSLRLGDESVVNMSMPIVIVVDDADKERIGESKIIALFDSVGKNPITIISE